MFKIPEWEKDVPKSNANLKNLLYKSKKKLKLKEAQASNHSPNSLTSKGISENKKTPVLQKINLQNKLKRNEKLKKKKPPGKLTKVLDHNKNSNEKTENTIYNDDIEKKLEPKPSNDDVKNYDMDKLDNAILNAKKKILIDSYIDDDNEEALFTEKLHPIVTNNNKNRNPSLQKTNNENTKQENTKQVIVDNNLYENSLSAVNRNNINKSKKRKHDKLHDTASNTQENTNKKSKSTYIVPKNKLRIDKQNTKNNQIPQENQLSNEKYETSLENNKTTPENDYIKTKKLNNMKNTVSLKQKIKKISISNMFQRHHINVNGNKLRERMLEKLKAAKFRFLNEKLYTSSGSDAQKLFQDDPLAFETYHQGYQQQVRKWPVNPLDIVVKRIKNMPKTHIVADMGCGEAALSHRVTQTVRSFDLVATAPEVEVCNIAHTPLLSASVHVAVYCLALMGTDLTQYLVEANRVLKIGGHLLIAEVESRFDNVDEFVKEVRRLGFELRKLDKSHKLFYFIEFTKEREAPVKKAKLPALFLKPCIYKKR